ncbi:hypothetical protein BSPWISOXPB_4125 [uncultured Gammaproteobacteria bacterium]|nr:hypothetical protein BSPWISOXPB_4125 [uncultured Gammaproteobacteria bacterium]
MSHKTYEKAMESYERYVRLSKIEVGVLSHSVWQFCCGKKD